MIEAVDAIRTTALAFSGVLTATYAVALIWIMTSEVFS